MILAACASGGTTTHSFVYVVDMPSHVQYAAANAPVPVAVFREPFAGGGNSATVAAMQRRNPGPPITFASASAATTSPYRVLVAFGPPPLTGCAAPPTSELRMPPGRTEVSAVFCAGTRVISDANASGPPLQGPDDPRLARLMQDLLSALMPASDPINQNSGVGSGSM